MERLVIKKVMIVAAIVIVVFALAACGAEKGSKPDSAGCLDGFKEADMSGYEGLEGYDGELPFVEVTVQEVHKLMEEKQTFTLFMSFPNCPWCNAVIKQFVEVAKDAGVKVANINTRKNPDWTSNTVIDDYDLFVEDFGECLDYDDAGIKHLYVPHVFFVKDGVIVYDHQGAIAAMGSDPYMQLSAAQEEELKDIFREGFEKLK